jgi:dCTP deaminase
VTILVDWQIEAYLQRPQQPLVIEPTLYPIQPASIDLRLGDTIIDPNGGRVFDPANGVGPEDQAKTFTIHTLAPGDFVNVATLEYVEIPPDVVGKLEGKSTLARMGLQVESAGYVDQGWKGVLTLELKNLGWDSIILRPGMRICQLRLYAVPRSRRLYGDPALSSHYQGAQGAQTARLQGYGHPDQTPLEPEKIEFDPTI